MKKLHILSILFAIAFLFGGCEDTNQDLLGPRGVAVIPTMTEPQPAFFTSDFENSRVSFTVDLNEGDEVDSAEVQISYKGKRVTFQQIESFPSDINISILDAIEALGISEADVKIDDSFFVEVVTEANGVTSRSLASVLVNVTCFYDEALTTGSYHVISEDWQVEGNVTITADPDDPYILYIEDMAEMEGLVGNGNKIKLNVSPNSFKMSGPSSTIAADLAPWGLPYTGYTYTPVGGLYKSCDGSFNLQVKITVDQGSFGVYNFAFTRND